jgi:hypothetical protein
MTYKSYSSWPFDDQIYALKRLSMIQKERVLWLVNCPELMWLPVDNQVLSPMSARTQPQANLNYKGIYSLNKGKRGEKVRILKTPQKPRFKKNSIYGSFGSKWPVCHSWLCRNSSRGTSFVTLANGSQLIHDPPLKRELPLSSCKEPLSIGCHKWKSRQVLQKKVAPAWFQHMTFMMSRKQEVAILQ